MSIRRDNEKKRIKAIHKRQKMEKVRKRIIELTLILPTNTLAEEAGAVVAAGLTSKQLHCIVDNSAHFGAALVRHATDVLAERALNLEKE